MAETAEQRREAVVEAALGALDLDAKTRLLAGQDMWSLPAIPEAGLASLVMSDGPIGVRGVHWSAEDPSVALPSPTALAATWDPELARRAGVLLAQESRRKGVHVLLAPTVNLHAPRSAAVTSRPTARTRTSPDGSAPSTSAASSPAASAPPSSTSSPTTPRPTASP